MAQHTSQPGLAQPGLLIPGFPGDWTTSDSESMSLVDSSVVALNSTDSVSFTDLSTLTLTSSDGLTLTDTETPAAAVLFNSDSIFIVDTSVRLATDSQAGRDLVQGPALVYVADYGTPEPTDMSSLNPAVWTSLGGTLGGVEIVISQTLEDKAKTVQQPDSSMGRYVKRSMTAKMNLAEVTLQNLLYAANVGSVTSGAGYSYFLPGTVDRATPLTYKTVIIDGWAPAKDVNSQVTKRRRLIMRKCLSTDSSVVSYSKEKQTTQSVLWTVHGISDSVTPFKIIDEE